MLAFYYDKSFEGLMCAVFDAFKLKKMPESDLIIFRYICKVFKSTNSIETDFADADVLAVYDIAKKVNKEKHHIQQFVRFNSIQNPANSCDNNDKIYFAVIEPIYNALPLTTRFFKDRYADQKWAIYDEKRQYGYFYDLDKIEQIWLNDNDPLIVNKQINQDYKGKICLDGSGNIYPKCKANKKRRINRR